MIRRAEVRLPARDQRMLHPVCTHTQPARVNGDGTDVTLVIVALWHMIIQNRVKPRTYLYMSKASLHLLQTSNTANMIGWQAFLLGALRQSQYLKSPGHLAISHISGMHGYLPERKRQARCHFFAQLAGNITFLSPGQKKSTAASLVALSAELATPATYHIQSASPVVGQADSCRLALSAPHFRLSN